MSAALTSRQRRKEARPAEFLAAALDVFVERGFSAARLEEIAERVGVSKGTLYLYYDSKESLFKAVVETSIVPTLAEGEALFAAAQDDPAALLRQLLRVWWERVGNTPLAGIAKLMLAEAGNFPELAAYYRDNVIQRGMRLLTSTLQLGMERGVFRRHDPDLLCKVVIAPLWMASLWQCSFDLSGKGETDYAHYIEVHLDVLMGGLLQKVDE
ncbi:TetR/AcrR family transcriptional regulator [Uliginosibacterium sediminicola]|uniref:TetR/AcrR family transcriptional regulator n=1 Tax=Uliginosibacterium sediminicola TaxID=2024550 RepID=A0ABU9Z2H7_9RHOO